ncbi:putative sodium bile acid cotransporter [Naematelia encephala]|uniref:Putative sodium bile acid cotransporter n=1 Tax=Naematelia encephala TaxID=71784 RepID=A0A1Y2AWX3_9TREE|nr:putative sodium bile acid cotransporter [Naematelia encephala]
MPADAPGKERSRLRSTLLIARSIFDFLLGQWLLIAMGLVIMLAYFFPSVGKRGGHVASQWTVTYGAVIVIFLISGLSLPFDKLVLQARNIRLHLIVQVTSFLVTSAVFFGIATAASTSSAIETSTLVGLIATGTLPTTISSNVVMTRQAKGDVAATMVEVTLGNFLGPFLSPLLLTKLYLPAVSAFQDWIPADASNNLPALYRSVMKQMGLSVFVPLAVGQVIRAIWPKQVQKCVEVLRLPKLGSLCLLALIWATFCNAFASHSLETINTPSIVFNVFVNLALCITFTAFSFFLARPPLFAERWSPLLFRRMSREETTSVCFCAPAKTQALGIPLITAMYTTSDDMTRALIQVPMILYTAEQIVVGQVLVYLFRRWERNMRAKEEQEKQTDPGEASVESMEMAETDEQKDDELYITNNASR